jgi:hypothetical protein
VVADTSKARRSFPDIDPMPYPQAVERALANTEAELVTTRWSGALGSMPEHELTTEKGLVRETRTRWTDASVDAVYGVVASLGGRRGWLFWNWAWWLRGLLDRLMGGPGLRRGRRHPSEVMPGDAIDFWRVEAADPPKLLRLRAEMKVPGKAWLQWEVVPERNGTRLIQTALFAPKGLTGTLYWNSLYPIHKIMFSGMVRRIVRAAGQPTP